MCGICGVTYFNGDRAEISDLRKMTDRMAHRGPNAEGQWVSADGRTGLGHRRLSILDLSDAGKQPMSFASGRYTITFNGEIYNYLEIRSDLEKKGHLFTTLTDTEVILALYADRGEDCLSALEGMFAFAIWDEQSKSLFCARDRMGEKPFYYYFEPGKQFAFASEMKCLFVTGISRRVREDRLFSYLAFDAVEDRLDLSSTFYESIDQLEPAHCLRIGSDGKVTKRRYWEVGAARTALPFDEARARFVVLFEESVRRRLRSDVPVGTCLSGGLDSSSIVVTMDQMMRASGVRSGPPIKTFSARMPDPKYDEGQHMREITQCTSVEPHEVWVSPEEAIDRIDDVFFHQEEPFGTMSCLSQWMVMKLASEQGVTVLIDGQGSDEMLAGYNGFFSIYYQDLYRTDRAALRDELKSYEVLYGKSFDFGVAAKIEAMCPGWVNRLGQLRRTLFVPPSFMSIHPDKVQRFRRMKPPFERSRCLDHALRRSSFGGGLTYLLRMCDRNSMAFSREVRLPFLSHELIEFVFSLPSSYKIHQGWTKYILRKSLEPLLPPSITWRKDKKGFSTPHDEWLAQPRLRGRCDEAANFLKKQGWLAEPDPKRGWTYLQAAMLLRSE